MQSTVKKLQKEMGTLFDSLGIDFQDTFDLTLNSTQQIYQSLKKTREKLSKLAATLSAVIVEVSQDNHIENMEDLKSLTAELGNLQFTLDGLMKRYQNLIKVTKGLMLDSISLGEELFEIQQKCVNIFKYNSLFKDAKIKGFNY